MGGKISTCGWSEFGSMYKERSAGFLIVRMRKVIGYRLVERIGRGVSKQSNSRMDFGGAPPVT